MSDFDPKAYLAQAKAKKAEQEFDPKAYLAQAKARSKDAPPTADEFQRLTTKTPLAKQVNDTLRDGVLGGLHFVGDKFERYVTAPARAGVSAAEDLQNPIVAWWNQVGEDSSKAASGKDIVKKLGVPDVDYAAHSKEPSPNDPDFFRFNNDPLFHEQYLKTGKGVDYTNNPADLAGKAADFLIDPTLAAGPVLKGARMIPGIASELDLMAAAAKSGAESAGRLGKSAVARTSSLMTGVPHEAIERLIERPTEVLRAEKKGNALRVAEKARQEFQAKAAAEDAAIGQARKAAASKYGDQPVSTSPITDRTDGFLEETAPLETAGGTIQGPVTDAERSSLSRYRKIMEGDGSKEMKFRELQKLADEIKTKSDLDAQGIAPGSKKTRGQGFHDSLYGQIKSAMHEVSPELAAADARYTEYATDADRLGKLEDPNQMEGFINNYYGKNKTIMRQSAQKVIPGSVEDISDIGARRAFSAQGPAGSEMGRRSIGGVAAGLGVAGTTHSPTLGVLTALSTSPQAHMQVIGRASQMMDALKKAVRANPELVNSISNPGLRSAMNQMIQEEARSASLRRVAENKGDADRKTAGRAQKFADGGEVKTIGQIIGYPGSGQSPKPNPKKPRQYARGGGPVPGVAQVKGDSTKNDIVPAVLSPGEIVLPRSVTMAENAPKAAAQFVADHLKRVKGHKSVPTLKHGKTEDGFIFYGGDPSESKNWKKLNAKTPAGAQPWTKYRSK
jgi:hypothetical protein